MKAFRGARFIRACGLPAAAPLALMALMSVALLTGASVCPADKPTAGMSDDELLQCWVDGKLPLTTEQDCTPSEQGGALGIGGKQNWSGGGMGIGR